MNPVAVLYSWFQEYKELFVTSGAELDFKDSGRGSGCVRLETDVYLMELSAWDHAFCLDIQIIEVKSEESSFHHSGGCESIDEFKQHLNEFLIWFKGAVVKNA